MYLRKHYRKTQKGREAYWALVESYRTERGPRQRVVAYLGEVAEGKREGVKIAAGGKGQERSLFEEGEGTEWVEVDAKRVRVERNKRFGGPWLGIELLRKLGLREYLAGVMPRGEEEIEWSLMALVLVISRLCDPRSELSLAEHGYEQSALGDLLGIPPEKVNDDRLYRSLDQLLPHKEGLERYLKEQMGELFELEYDLLLYDMTSTYFEGEGKRNALAARGYSRDGRPECKQVCIGLVVSRCGMPLGYEVYEGNRSDGTTVKEMVEKMEERYGKAKRVFVMDRGMVSERTLEWMRDGGRRYLVGTAKSRLKQFERELLEGDFEEIREGLEVKLCPTGEGEETFILCRSAQRREKEEGIHRRFEERIEAGLEKLAVRCEQRKQKPEILERRIGRLLGQNSRGASLFKVEVKEKAQGGAKVVWQKLAERRGWNELSEGCYLLRSNVGDWEAKELWRTYIQLTEAEAAFRIQKSDLRLRPIWHQKTERVQAHILVCFLAYVLWKTLGRWCHGAGLGDEPRKVFDELSQIQQLDVVLPTKSGVEIKKRCVTRPTPHQAILLQHLKLQLPSHTRLTEMTKM